MSRWEYSLLDSAAKMLKSHAVRTPLVESSSLNKLVGGRVLVKLENLQKSGSFKYRGALHRLSMLTPEEKENGVVAFSSGNFAQGLATAAGELGIPCTVVMPHDAPRNKIERTKVLGAHVVLSTPEPGENREVAADAVAVKYASEHGAVRLHPFDDWAVIAGQGTVGMEIVEDVRARGTSAVHSVLVCAGGGGLTAGIALALHRDMPSAQVYTVEPEGYDDWARSLSSKAVQRVEGTPATICEALQAAAPGEKPFSACLELGVKGLVVHDDAVRRAMIVAFDELKVILEPSGAIALAALLDGKIDAANKTTVVIASGGNVDIPSFFQHVNSKL